MDKEINILVVGNPCRGSPSLMDMFEITSVSWEQPTITPSVYLQNNEPVDLNFIYIKSHFSDIIISNDADFCIIIGDKESNSYWNKKLSEVITAQIIEFDANNSVDFKR